MSEKPNAFHKEDQIRVQSDVEKFLAAGGKIQHVDNGVTVFKPDNLYAQGLTSTNSKGGKAGHGDNKESILDSVLNLKEGKVCTMLKTE